MLSLRAGGHPEAARRTRTERRKQLKPPLAAPIVVPASAEQKFRLDALFELYMYDLSAVFALDVEADGRFAVPDLSPYWSEPGRHPFLIHVGAHIAGFALVDSVSRITDDTRVHDVAEFFVVRKYRRKGVGERAAAFLFDSFPGRWEVRQRMENVDATAFWRRVIARYTKGRFVDVVWEDTRWRGPVQRFESAEV